MAFVVVCRVARMTYSTGLLNQSTVGGHHPWQRKPWHCKSNKRTVKLGGLPQRVAVGMVSNSPLILFRSDNHD